MATTARPDDASGGGHDRSERERDVLRELHELIGRLGPGDPELRSDAGRESGGSGPASPREPGLRSGPHDERR